jgi:hypothetical protein
VTGRIEGITKRGRTRIRWTDECDEDLKIMGNETKGLEEDFICSQGPQRTVQLKGEEKHVRITSHTSVTDLFTVY